MRTIIGMLLARLTATTRQSQRTVYKIEWTINSAGYRYTVRMEMNGSRQ